MGSLPAKKSIRMSTQQEVFAQFAWNFRATIKNNMQLTYYMVARKFRASCVKSSCRVLAQFLSLKWRHFLLLVRYFFSYGNISSNAYGNIYGTLICAKELFLAHLFITLMTCSYLSQFFRDFLFRLISWLLNMGGANALRRAKLGYHIHYQIHYHMYYQIYYYMRKNTGPIKGMQ